MMKIIFAFVTILCAATVATASSNDQVGVRLLAPHNGCSSDDYSKIQASLGEAYQVTQQRRNLRSQQQQQYIEPRCQFICSGLGERCSMLHPVCMKSVSPSDQRRRLDTTTEPEFHLVEETDSADFPACGEMRSLAESTFQHHRQQLSETCQWGHHMNIQCFTLSFTTASSGP